MLAAPVLTDRIEQGRRLPLLVWRLATPLRAISSAPLGGGLGLRRWVVNATVPMSYHRDDPDTHLAGLAADLGLTGPGIGLLTGVDVAEVVARGDDGVRVWATVGLGTPIWAAADPAPAATAGRVGTVNIVAFVPAPLTDAALVNAVATATEAKAQALRELELPATGTATDAVTVLCPAASAASATSGRPVEPPGPPEAYGSPEAYGPVEPHGPVEPPGPAQAYGGPRSRWGAPLARAVRSAVRDGGAVPCVPWSVRHGRRPADR